jgi:hypothetical protein
VAIIRLINEAALDVKEDAEEVAGKIRREGQVIRLTDLYDPGEMSIWVNVAAIASFIDKKTLVGSPGSFEVKVEQVN